MISAITEWSCSEVPLVQKFNNSKDAYWTYKLSYLVKEDETKVQCTCWTGWDLEETRVLLRLFVRLSSSVCLLYFFFRSMQTTELRINKTTTQCLYCCFILCPLARSLYSVWCSHLSSFGSVLVTKESCDHSLTLESLGWWRPTVCVCVLFPFNPRCACACLHAYGSEKEHQPGFHGDSHNKALGADTEGNVGCCEVLLSQLLWRYWRQWWNQRQMVI